jgi:predicted  nucleic acid-binding Zn-ribbon protein
MTQTLEQRVAELEKQVSDLNRQLQEDQPRKKNWEKSFGIFKDDPHYESAMKLGREWREAQTYEKEIARS